MKILILLFLSILLSNEVTTTLNIKGMMCENSCVKSVTNAVDGLNGIKSCEVNFNNETATIKYDNSVIDVNQIKKIISEKTYFKVNKKSNESSFWNWFFGNDN